VVVGSLSRLAMEAHRARRGAPCRRPEPLRTTNVGCRQGRPTEASDLFGEGLPVHGSEVVVHDGSVRASTRALARGVGGVGARRFRSSVASGVAVRRARWSRRGAAPVFGFGCARRAFDARVRISGSVRACLVVVRGFWNLGVSVRRLVWCLVSWSRGLVALGAVSFVDSSVRLSRVDRKRRSVVLRVLGSAF
jgi:hypothetical protein